MARIRYNLSLCPTSALERHVVRIAKSECSDGDLKSYIKDVLYGGCQSGCVSALIYYKATHSFYKRHASEIAQLLASTLSDMGASGPADLLRDWDADDPCVLDSNRNLLAWFAFEETLRTLAHNAGYDE